MNTEHILSLPVKKVHPDAVLPTRAHPDDAGMDLYALHDVTIPAQGGTKISTGIAMALPAGTVGMICDRSSMASKGLKTAGGIVDAGYRGEILVVMRNLTHEPVVLKAKEKIAQMLVIPLLFPMPAEVNDLDSTTRGVQGFGSTGR